MRRPLTQDQVERKAALVARYEAEREAHFVLALAEHEAQVAALVLQEVAEQRRQRAEADAHG